MQFQIHIYDQNENQIFHIILIMLQLGVLVLLYEMIMMHPYQLIQSLNVILIVDTLIQNHVSNNPMTLNFYSSLPDNISYDFSLVDIMVLYNQNVLYMIIDLMNQKIMHSIHQDGVYRILYYVMFIVSVSRRVGRRS